MMMEEGGGGGGGKRESSISVITSSSPEFEFWKVPNPSFPQTQLLSADELFVDGVLLPLHLIHSHTQSESKPDKSNVDSSESTPPVAPPTVVLLSADSAPVTSSKRWKGIFRGASGDKKAVMVTDEKFRRRKWRSGGGGAAELNINIWPFSRSRSAGDKAVRMGFPVKSVAAGRKVSSAPCSRSNSRGEPSKIAGGSKSLATVSGKVGGVHVGRTNPIWRIRKGGKKTQMPPQTAIEEEVRKEVGEVENGDDSGGKKVNGNRGVRIEILNLNVKTRIAKMRLKKSTSCSGKDETLLTDGGEQINGGGGVSSHLNLKAFFSKKVY